MYLSKFEKTFWASKTPQEFIDYQRILRHFTRTHDENLLIRRFRQEFIQMYNEMEKKQIMNSN